MVQCVAPTQPRVPTHAQVLEDMHSRPTPSMRPALVVNLDVKDSHEEAAMAAPQALELCTLVRGGGLLCGPALPRGAGPALCPCVRLRRLLPQSQASAATRCRVRC